MQNQSLNLNQLVALFLAETIRSRRTSLSRAAEISRRVLKRLGSIKSETQALTMLQDIEKDFDEVSTLKQALHFGYRQSDIKVYEPEIRDFASKLLLKDIKLSNAFLQDAAKPNATIQEICLKYPDFCNFLICTSEKGGLLASLKTA